MSGEDIDDIDFEPGREVESRDVESADVEVSIDQDVVSEAVGREIRDILDTLPLEGLVREAVLAHIDDEKLIAGNLTEEQLETIAENIPSENVPIVMAETANDALSATETPGNIMNSEFPDILRERPQIILYAFATVVMMAAVYLSSPLLALAGGLLLIMTALHYAGGRRGSGDLSPDS